MQDPCPSQLDEVLRPDWLSRALSTEGAPVDVAEVVVIETLKTMATKVRFKVAYSSPQPALGANFCVKGFFGDPQEIAISSSSSRAEAMFYQDFAPDSGITVPNCRYVGINPGSGHGLIIMDDIVAGGGTFLSALSPYTFAQAAASLDQLAIMHSEHWGGPDGKSFPWLVNRLEGMATQSYLAISDIQQLMDGPRGGPLDPGTKDAARIYRCLQALAVIDRGAQSCLVHGDAHAGNIFEIAGAPGLIDWQIVQRAHWALDVAYHIAATLTVEDRRRHEQALLRHYLESLSARGVVAPGWDEAWLAYRRHLIYGHYLWALTRRVEVPVILEFVKRLGTAVQDHDTFALL